MRIKQHSYIALLLCMTVFSVHAQEIIAKKDVNLKRAITSDREAFPIINPADSSIALFLISEPTIYGVLFDSKLNTIAEISDERPSVKFSQILGYSLTKDTYSVIMGAKNHEDFVAISFNFAQKISRQTQFSIPFEKQHYAGAISNEGKFYILTTSKGTSTLNLYEVDDAGHYTTHSFDFKGEEFASTQYTNRLDDVIRIQSPVSVDNQIPNPIELTSRKSKIYCANNKLILTLDHQLFRTAVITINLGTFESSLKFFKQGKIECGSTANASSSSYLHDGILYQMKVCPSSMIFSVNKLSDGSRTQEFRASKDEDMTFINSPILQVTEKPLIVASVENERELSTTRQFLRKTSAAESGISVSTTSQGIEVTLGSYQILQYPGQYLPVSPVAPYQYYPTYSAFRISTSTKSTYVKCVLAPETFAHQTGNAIETGFERMQLYVKELGNKTVAETIIKKENGYILGYYLKSSDQYIMHWFAR